MIVSKKTTDGEKKDSKTLKFQNITESLQVRGKLEN